MTDVDGVPEQDLFTLSVSDGSASSANSSITIDIVDDVPVAVDDSRPWGEDDSAAISGNVLSNDLHGNGEAGADAPVTFVQWTGSTSGQYGSFTDNGNGGYSYTLNTAHAAVQGLDDGQSLTETFSYQITDADGDTDTATLTLTINGSNDGPGVSVDPGNVGRWVTTASTKRVWPAVPPQVTAAMPPAVPLPCPTPMPG
ncbi:VCBS domain-containing protein [Marinobacterium rhizophilum]|uniref:VCBS domain-containing protein n=1 Tax=Marinobacterium rhizophilum TaxID=420402 RepID=A0ABY5HJ40_9GAMM|nr:VCBS domain-containing protein [Marinobacterium rhizophilum]UTW11270.1 VCBS domain-containing protein [Marinobacterium rhizophilum]